MEFVNAEIFPLMHSFLLMRKINYTHFVEHIALQIAMALPKKFKRCSLPVVVHIIFFCLERMKLFTNNGNVVPDDKTLEFKEALIFGLLGVLRLRNEINVLSSVTGAKNDHCSGMLYINHNVINKKS
jgi:anhydro-N-acetylmuramic acid kinase